jgi:hypothetical protein
MGIDLLGFAILSNHYARFIVKTAISGRQLNRTLAV